MTDTPEPLSDGELMRLTNLILSLKDPKPMLCAVYKNYKGDINTRKFTPLEIRYGSTEWHPEPCLLLRAFDHWKDGERDFKLADFDMKTLRVAL